MPHIETRLLTDRFQRTFGRPARLLTRAPGRVNLIGEHTDYNDGFVLPAAIDYWTLVAASARDDRRIRAMAVDVEGQQVSFHLDEPMVRDPGAPWSDYLRGVVQELRRDGFGLKGVDLLIHGNVPRGAGLSSSASLEMALVRALTGLSGEPIEPVQAARVGQRAENRFVGCQCGIMDQLVSATGQADSALLIDCRDLATRPVALPPQWALMIVESGVRRGLVDSEYNLRRRQCEAVAHHFGVSSLRDLSLAQLQHSRRELEPALFRRAHHVLSENERTLAASEALTRGDLSTIAAVMMESHRSMRDDFEITTPALDTLVSLLARAAHGQAGVRMTGGGFGGCVIALTPVERVPALEAVVGSEYPARTGCRPRLIPARASGGAFAPEGLEWLDSGRAGS